MNNIVYDDVISQMEQLHKKGFRLPEGYDKNKHSISDNEIRLYEQQIKMGRHRDQRKVSYILNFSALGLNWFCQCMNFDWIKTSKLPSLVREALKDGEFEDSLEGIGTHLRGTIFDNPIFSLGLKFVEKVGEAHHLELEEEQEKLEKEAEEQDFRKKTKLAEMNKYRSAPLSNPLSGLPQPQQKKMPT
jgi:hypothetical protein